MFSSAQYGFMCSGKVAKKGICFCSDQVDFKRLRLEIEEWGTFIFKCVNIFLEVSYVFVLDKKDLGIVIPKGDGFLVRLQIYAFLICDCVCGLICL